MLNLWPVLGLLVLGACNGSQSVLDPAGVDAEVLASLFWVLLIGAVVLWLLLNGAFFYVTRMRVRPYSRKIGEAVIFSSSGAARPAVESASIRWAISLPVDRAVTRMRRPWWREVIWIPSPLAAASTGSMVS